MNKWISVKDKLPEMYVEVIVRLHTGKVARSSVQRRNITSADQQITVILDWFDQSNPQVTHWIPLPEEKD